MTAALVARPYRPDPLNLGSHYHLVAARCLANPGKPQVARADFRSTSTARAFAAKVRLGLPRAFTPAGRFEGSSSGTTVWVRYLGPS